MSRKSGTKQGFFFFGNLCYRHETMRDLPGWVKRKQWKHNLSLRVNAMPRQVCGQQMESRQGWRLSSDNAERNDGSVFCVNSDKAWFPRTFMFSPTISPGVAWVRIMKTRLATSRLEQVNSTTTLSLFFDNQESLRTLARVDSTNE